MSPRKLTDRKSEELRKEGALNPHPEAVEASTFQQGEFFDPRDMVQVKYEMLRRVQIDGQAVSRSAREFGVSRPTFYEAQKAFDQGGLPGLLARKRGPRGPHKLRGEILEFARERILPGEPIRATELVKEIKARFGVSIHARTIERAFRRPEKKRRRS